MMTIAYQDIVLLNTALRARNLRYRVSWQDASTACVEPPGECCLTDELKRQAYDCIEQWFAARGARVVWSVDGLYFSLEPRA